MLCVIPAFPELEVFAVRSGKTVLLLPIEDGERFSIRYTHSVNRLPVTDTLENTGGTLTVRTSSFTAFGAGIPVAEDEGEVISAAPDGGLLLTGINNEYKTVNLMTGTYADHYLIWRGREFRLKEYAGEQTLLRLSVKRAGAARWLLGRLSLNF